MGIMEFVTTAALSLWCVQNLITTFLVVGYRRGLPLPEIPEVEPRVAVILPVRGAVGLSRHLPLLRAQLYGRYRIIASVESVDDPAYALLTAAEAEPGAPIEVAVAGLAVNSGQKVWNLLAALARLKEDDDVVAFIDADTLPTPLWLPRLVAVLVNSGRPVATGYRWMTPADDRWSSSCLAAANNSVAMLPRGVMPMTMVWGGSVALLKATLKTIRIEDYWRGAISDDVQMSEALRSADFLAHAPRQALLLSPVSCTWAEFIGFGVRQYRIIFLHRPGSWALVLASLWAPPICLLLIAPSLAAGSHVAWLMAAFVLGLGELRTWLRRDLQRVLWPEIDGPRDERRWRVERLMRPVWHLMHAVSAAGAPLSRTIDWAGVRYRVEGPQTVIIEARKSPS
jgi:hypothetical protein